MCFVDAKDGHRHRLIRMQHLFDTPHIFFPAVFLLLIAVGLCGVWLRQARPSLLTEQDREASAQRRVRCLAPLLF